MSDSGLVHFGTVTNFGYDEEDPEVDAWNIRFDEKIVEYKDPNLPIGHDENMVLEEVEKAIKLYEENKDLDTGNMEVSEDEESMASI